ncbi:MAG TPA: hypothetical protein VI318_16035 [Baekduia sp.]
MPLPLRKTSLIAVAVAVSSAASVASAATPYSAPSGRPHSRVVTYDRGTVRTLALQAATTRSGGHLTVRATITLRNLTSGTITRFVRAGRCISGSGAAPACRADALFSVRLAGGETKTLTPTITLRQPPSKVDAIELAVQAGRRQPAYFSHGDAELLLKGNAWRGPSAGATYGVAFPAGDDRAKRLNFDVPVTDPGRAYVDVIWTGTAAPGAPTTLGKCTGSVCTTGPIGPAQARSGPQQFGDRFDVDNDGHSSLTLGVTDVDGTPLITAALPWPAKVS